MLAVSAALALAGSMMSIRMVNAINRRRPPEAQFEMRGCYGNKSFRLREEYKRLYPEGTLHNVPWCVGPCLVAAGTPEAACSTYMPTNPAMSVSHALGSRLLDIMLISVQGTTP